MVRWRVAELLAERGWSVYRLIKASGLTPPVAYRVAKPGREVRRVEGRTLNALCAALKVGPGDLLEYVPDRKRRKRRKQV
jgi:DNA-binding Xre family transcriptional regulator